MPSRIATDPLDWLSLSAPNEIPEGDAERQKRTALALLERLYGADAVPGVILADEVGMGKTYVVFAVMAALMRDRPRAKTLVLTHSRQMARIWQKRWATFCARLLDTGIDLKADAVVVADACRIGASRLAFGSFDTIKHLPPEFVIVETGRIADNSDADQEVVPGDGDTAESDEPLGARQRVELHAFDGPGVEFDRPPLE